MNIIITGHQMHLTDSTKEFITEKATSKLIHYKERLHKVTVVLDKEHITYTCGCDITSDFGSFHASATSENKESAIDGVIDKIVHEIKKKHDKIVNHHHKKTEE